MKQVVLVVLAVVVVGCSHGLQETAFKDGSGRYIVSRSLVNDRVTANQPHITGVFACMRERSKTEMRDLQTDGAEHTKYVGCEPIEQFQPGAYQQTSDQPIGTLYKGPVEAAIIGGSIGAGLALSGTEVVQQGGGASARSSSTSTSSASNRRRHH